MQSWPAPLVRIATINSHFETHLTLLSAKIIFLTFLLELLRLVSLCLDFTLMTQSKLLKTTKRSGFTLENYSVSYIPYMYRFFLSSSPFSPSLLRAVRTTAFPCTTLAVVPLWSLICPKQVKLLHHQPSLKNIWDSIISNFGINNATRDKQWYPLIFSSSEGCFMSLLLLHLLPSSLLLLTHDRLQPTVFYQTRLEASEKGCVWFCRQIWQPVVSQMTAFVGDFSFVAL